VAKDQHLIPAFYLRHFTDPSAATPDPYLWVYDPETKSWKRRAPKNVATKRHYFSYTDEAGELHHDMDEFLQRVENVTAPLLAKRLASPIQLNEEDQGTLAIFVATMMIRPESFHDSIVGSLGEVVSMTHALQLHHWRQHPESFDAFKRDYRNKTGDDSFDSLTVDQIEAIQLQASVNRGFAISAALQTVPNSAKIVLGMDWQIVKATAPDFFTTSDRPFMMLWPDNPYQPGSFHHAVGLAHRHIEVTLPLTRETALLARWPEDEDAEPTVSEFHATREQVGQINWRTASQSKLLFAPSPNCPWADQLEKESEQ
jgi:hypothetical protein